MEEVKNKYSRFIQFLGDVVHPEDVSKLELLKRKDVSEVLLYLRFNDVEFDTSRYDPEISEKASRYLNYFSEISKIV